EWDVAGAGDPTVQGFATDISVTRANSPTSANTVHFKINVTNAGGTSLANVAFKVDIYRLGYYNGNGARRMTSTSLTGLSTFQPACLTNTTTGLVDCGNWSE